MRARGPAVAARRAGAANSASGVARGGLIPPRSSESSGQHARTSRRSAGPPSVTAAAAAAAEGAVRAPRSTAHAASPHLAVGLLQAAPLALPLGQAAAKATGSSGPAFSSARPPPAVPGLSRRPPPLPIGGASARIPSVGGELSPPLPCPPPSASPTSWRHHSRFRASVVRRGSGGSPEPGDGGESRAGGVRGGATPTKALGGQGQAQGHKQAGSAEVSAVMSRWLDQQTTGQVSAGAGRSSNRGEGGANSRMTTTGDDGMKMKPSATTTQTPQLALAPPARTSSGSSADSPTAPPPGYRASTSAVGRSRRGGGGASGGGGGGAHLQTTPTTRRQST